MNPTNNIQLLDNVVRVKGNIVSDMDGEKVMLSIQNGKYYNLGEIGGEIWDLVESPTQVAEVVEALFSRYEVERSVCEEQTLAFLRQLAKESLVEVDRGS